ncbi:MAG: hypothetical protein NT159_18410 [Proteobacteria bacterium]|nr:hypothetical protein [Pseudomonadota bacterium]
MANTRHANVRAQQRGIPPLIDQWLDQFGEEEYTGAGFIKRYFSHRSIRQLEREFGRQPVSLMERYLRAYKLESSTDGTTITTGWLSARIRRK